MKRDESKAMYEPAELKIVLFDFSDIVTVSVLDEEDTSDSGGWTGAV